MSGVLVQLALSNLIVSAGLAGIAYAVHRRGRYPTLAHLLWVLVLAKLVTPPLLAITLVRLPEAGIAGAATSGTGSLAAAAPIVDATVLALLAAWAVGSALVLVVSLVRIVMFDRVLRRSSAPAGPRLQWLAGDVAYELGVSIAPVVYLTSARISPMTWWTGGRVRVVLPASLPADLEYDQLRWVLAHELAHVKRRDYLVRWLEWLACVAFWWNPIAWFARANLRLDEEAACDALVLEKLDAGGKPYARALLAVVEHLSQPAMQPPAVATGIDGGGSLERRLRLLVTGGRLPRIPRGLIAGIVALAVLVMPVGVGIATDEPPSRDAAATTWLAADVQPSAAETAFILAVARPANGDASAAEPATATVSAKLSPKQAEKAKRAAKAKATKKARAKAADAKKTKDGKKARKARQARKARAAERAAAQAPSVARPQLGLVIRF